MMNKKEKIVWILYAAVLILLFLLSSTDLIIKEQKNEVYRLSVVIEDSRDENYTNFRKGMDQAAMDLNADVSFITLYERNHLKQQVDLVIRERQDGAQALVIAPVDDAAVMEALEENQIYLPIVFFNSDMTGNPVKLSISPDYVDMGRKLAVRLKQFHKTSIPVCLIGEKDRSQVAGLFEHGIRSELERFGYDVMVLDVEDEKEYQNLLERRIPSSCRQCVLVALDQTSLVEMASLRADQAVDTLRINGLYGRGISQQILNYVDRGQIDGLCVTDDFTAGYRCVSSAVDLIQNRFPGEHHIRQESFYLEKEDLRKEEFETMLYPIE